MNIADEIRAQELACVLAEIAVENYTTIEQVRGAINNRIDELKGDKE